jgi:hypothetical protein
MIPGCLMNRIPGRLQEGMATLPEIDDPVQSLFSSILEEPCPEIRQRSHPSSHGHRSRHHRPVARNSPSQISLLHTSLRHAFKIKMFDSWQDRLSS